MGKRLISLNRQSKPIVKICIPYYESLPSEMMELCQQIIMGGIPGYRAALWHKQGTIIQFMRNEAIYDTPELDWDFLFFIDDDLGFQSEAFREKVIVDDAGKKYEVYYMVSLIKQILDHDLNICGGYYCQRNNPYLPLVFKKLYPDLPGGPWVNIVRPPDKGVIEVDGLATGFLCIKREVFDAFESRRLENLKIAAKFEKWRKNNPICPEIEEYLNICKPMIDSPFRTDNIYDPSKDKWVDIGEDMYFCGEAQKLGYKIYCDFSVQLGHMVKKYQTPAQYKHAFMQDQIEGHLEWAEKTGIKSPIMEFIQPKEKEAANG